MGAKLEESQQLLVDWHKLNRERFILLLSIEESKSRYEEILSQMGQIQIKLKRDYNVTV